MCDSDDQVVRSESPSAWRKVKARSRLLVEILLCSVVGSIGTVFTAVLRRQTLAWGLGSESILSTFQADVQRSDVILATVTKTGRLLDLVGGIPTYYICYCMFFPACFYFYLDRQWFPRKAMGLAVALYFALLILGYGYAGIDFFLLTNIAYAGLLCWAALKFGLTGNSLVPTLQLYQIFVLFFGTALVIMIIPRFPMNTNWHRLTFYCVAVPFFREVSRIVAARCTWHFSFNADIGIGGGDKHQSSDLAPCVNREHSWVFLGWVHCMWACYNRLSIANMSSPWMNVFVIGYQGILEIVLRLTMQQRDQYLSRVKKRLERLLCRLWKRSPAKPLKKSSIAPRSRAGMLKTGKTNLVLETALDLGTHRESSAIISRPLSVLNRELPRTDDERRHTAKRVFYSRAILSEMSSEFMSITVAYFLLVYWSDKPLLYPFDGYKDSSSWDTSWLILSAILQILFELIIDIICLVLERETDPFYVWVHHDKRAFLFLFAFASWYGSHLAVTFVTHVDDLTACIGENTTMCACVDNGLKPLGFRATFCRTLYPNATWSKDSEG